METKRGFDCEFVNEICKDVQTECSICLHVLCEPHIVECCGHRFCRACLAEIKMATDYACPLCRKPTFKDIPDRQLKRVLMAKRVYCSFRPNGCEWKGELCKLETHLNSNPQTDGAAWQEGCSYVEIPCPLCQRERMKRLVIEEHMANECPKKEVLCKFCRVHRSAYENIGKHHTVCPHVPVECPKGCQATLLRRNLTSHIEYSCPNNPQPCPFHIVGCNKKFAGRRMYNHLCDRSTLTAHLSMVKKKLTDRGWLIHSLNEEVKAKDNEITLLCDDVKTKDGEVASLHADLTQLKKKVEAKDEKIADLCKRQAHVYEVEIDRLKLQLKEEKSSLSALKKNLRDKEHPIDKLEKKIASGSVDHALRKSAELQHQAGAQRAKIDRLLQDKCGLEADLHREKCSLREATSQLAALKESLKRATDNNAQEIAKLKKVINSQKKELDSNALQKAALEEVIESQKRELDKISQQMGNLQEVVHCQKKDIEQINALEEMIGSQKRELEKKAQQIGDLQEVVRCQKKDIDRYQEQLRVDSTADGPTRNIDEAGVVGAALGVALGVGIAGVAALVRR